MTFFSIGFQPVSMDRYHRNLDFFVAEKPEQHFYRGKTTASTVIP